MNSSIFFLISLAIIASSAQAAPALVGNSVDFTVDDAIASLFTVHGDTLEFSPTDFKNQAVDSGTLTIAQIFNSLTNITITPKASSGFSTTINAISLLEGGAYNQRNLINSANTTAIAGVSGQISTSVTNFADLLPVNFALTGSASNPFQVSNWSSNASLPVSGTPSSALVLSLDNSLFAAALTVGDFAFINIKNASITVSTTTSPVPLPAAAWLFGAAFLSFLSISKRKNQL